MAAPQITDRAQRYRANKLLPVKGKRCLFCGSTRNLVPDHWDGHPDHTNPANLEVLCKSCNTAKGAAFKKAGRGRLTHQYNPTKGGGAANVGEWMQAVGAIIPRESPQRNETLRAGSTMSTQAAVDMIRATPQSKRKEFASRLRRRKNPAAASADVYREFHGHDSREVVTVSKKVHTHAHLAAAGTLRTLVVLGIDKQVHTVKGFKGALLAFNEDKNQLFVEGGDQSMNLEDFGIRKPHEYETLGKVKVIDYHADKSHLGDEGGNATYTHQFRTTNENGSHVVVKIARYPDLIYDVRNEQLLFSGGSYTIRAEGIDV